MMMNREAFVSQVATAVTSRLGDLEQYLGGPQGGLRAHAFQRAQELADMLNDVNQAATAARLVMVGMFGHTDVPNTFWRTEVGQTVARNIGYHKEAVPYVTAAAILGVSRQRIYQLCEMGRLRQVPGHHLVTPASVREALLAMDSRAA